MTGNSCISFNQSSMNKNYVRSYAWSFGHSDPDPSNVPKVVFLLFYRDVTTFVKDMKTKLGLNAKYEIHIFNGIYFLPHDGFKGLMGKLMTAKIASCAKGCVTGVPCIE